jgi:cob(I)alamin adenosyltransferase
MANVIQFKQTTIESSPRSLIQCHLDAYLLALAESELAVEVGKVQIEKDIKVIESVMRSTESPHLRELFLQQLTEIGAQLALARLELTNVKRQLLVVAASTGVRHPKTAWIERISEAQNL